MVEANERNKSSCRFGYMWKWEPVVESEFQKYHRKAGKKKTLESLIGKKSLLNPSLSRLVRSHRISRRK